MLRKSLTILTMSLWICTSAIGSPKCNEVLGKCIVTVTEQQETLDKKNQVIEQQKKVIKVKTEQNKELESQAEKRTIYEILGGVLLLLL